MKSVLNFCVMFLMALPFGALAQEVVTEQSGTDVDDETPTVNERYLELMKLFDDVPDYSEDTWWLPNDVIVKKNGKMGVVDIENDLFIPLKYDSISSESDYYEVWLNGKHGMLAENGALLLNPEYDFVHMITEQGRRFYIVGKGDINLEDKPTVDGKFALLDSSFNVLIPFKYNALMPITAGDQDLADQDWRIAAYDATVEKVGLLDFHGNVKVPFEYDSYSSYFCNRRLVMGKDDKCGLMDIDGNVIIPFIYDEPCINSDDDFFALGSQDENGETKIGFWDYNGNRLSDDVFNSCVSPFLHSGYYVTLPTVDYEDITLYRFTDGLARFRIRDKEDNPKYGFIDSHGKVVIEPKYDYAEPFSEGLAGVCVDDAEEVSHWGYIDKTGRMVIPAIYSSIGDFEQGVALVVLPVNDGHNSLVIDKKGNEVMRFEEDFVSVEIVTDDPDMSPLIKKEMSDFTKYYDVKRRLVKIVRDGNTIYPDKF